MDIYRQGIYLARVRKVKNLFKDFIEPVNLSHNDIGIFCKTLFFNPPRKELGGASYSTKWVFDFMGNAGSKCAQKSKPVFSYRFLLDGLMLERSLKSATAPIISPFESVITDVDTLIGTIPSTPGFIWAPRWYIIFSCSIKILP